MQAPDAAGFVLAGGLSRRMGADKALLATAGVTLLERAARVVAQAAGGVTIIGDPARYSSLGYPVIPDIRPGLGPLGGVVTGLAHCGRTWNLFLACDLPDVDADFLAWLLDLAAQASPVPDCVVPVSAFGPEPLCAVYHLRSLPAMQHALDRNILKMKTMLDTLNAKLVEVPDSNKFRNINTPEDWAAHG